MTCLLVASGDAAQAALAERLAALQARGALASAERVTVVPSSDAPPGSPPEPAFVVRASTATAGMLVAGLAPPADARAYVGWPLGSTRPGASAAEALAAASTSPTVAQAGAPQALECFLPWGRAPSRLFLARCARSASPDDGATSPAVVPDGTHASGTDVQRTGAPGTRVPLWRHVDPTPAAYVDFSSARSLVSPVRVRVPAVRLEAAEATAIRVELAWRLVPGSVATAVPPQSVTPQPAGSPAAQASVPVVPSLWLLDARAFARFVERVGELPERALDRFSLARLSGESEPEGTVAKRWVAAVWERERRISAGSAGHTLGRLGRCFAPVPGCTRLFVPAGHQLVPRLSPGRLTAALARDPAYLTLVDFLAPHPGAFSGMVFRRVPGSLFQSRNREGAGTTNQPRECCGAQGAAGADTDAALVRYELPEAAFVPLGNAVAYRGRFGRRPVAPVETLEPLVPRPSGVRAMSALIARGLPEVRRPVAPPTVRRAPAALGVPVSAGARKPKSRPATPGAPASTSAPRPGAAPKPRSPQATISDAPAGRDEVACLEEALAEALQRPQTAALAPQWFALAELRAAQSQWDEAAYALVAGLWLTPARSAARSPSRARTHTEARAEADTHAAAVALAAVARHLPDGPPAQPSGAASPERRCEFAPIAFVRLLADFWRWQVDDAVGAAAADPAQLVRLQHELPALARELSLRARWLLGSGLARLLDDPLRFERERECILAEINQNGLSRRDLAPHVVAWFGARVAGRSAADAAALAEETPAAVQPSRAEAARGAARVVPWVRDVRGVRAWVTHLGWLRAEAGLAADSSWANLADLAQGELLLALGRVPDAIAAELEPLRQAPERAAKTHAGDAAPTGFLRPLVRLQLAELGRGRRPDASAARGDGASDSLATDGRVPEVLANANADAARCDAFRQIAQGLTSGGPGERLLSASASRRARLSRWLAGLGLAWATTEVRAIWAACFAEAPALAVDLLSFAPAPWLDLLGARWATQTLVPLLIAHPQEAPASETARLWRLGAATLRHCRRAAFARLDFEDRLPSARAPDAAALCRAVAPLAEHLSRTATARLAALAAYRSSDGRWDAELDPLAGVLAALAEFDVGDLGSLPAPRGSAWLGEAPALGGRALGGRAPGAAAPGVRADGTWLRRPARLFLALAAHRARRGRLAEALALVRQVFETFSRAYPAPDDLPAPVRAQVKFWLADLFETLPLCGNRGAARELIDAALVACPRDPYSLSVVYAGAARALARLGDRQYAAERLAALVCDALGALDNQELFDTLSAVLPIATELFPAEVTAAVAVAPVRRELASRFQGSAGDYYGFVTAVLVGFAEAATGRSEDAARSLPALKFTGARARRLAPAEIRDATLHYGRQYLRAGGLERAGGLDGFFAAASRLAGVTADNSQSLAGGFRAQFALAELEQLGAHLAGAGGTESPALAAFRRRETLALRDRIAWEGF